MKTDYKKPNPTKIRRKHPNIQMVIIFRNRVYRSGPEFNDRLYIILIYKRSLYFGTVWYGCGPECKDHLDICI